MRRIVLAGRRRQRLVFQVFELLGIELQDRKALVDDRVEQRIDQKADVVLPQPRALGPDPLANRVPDVPFGLLKRQQRLAPQNETDLLAVHVAVERFPACGR